MHNGWLALNMKPSVQRQDACDSSEKFSIFCRWGREPSLPSRRLTLHTRGLGQSSAKTHDAVSAGPDWAIGCWKTAGQAWRASPCRFTCCGVTPVVSALVDAWSRNSHPYGHAVIAARRLPLRYCSVVLSPQRVAAPYSACAVRLAARWQAIDERVSEGGRALAEAATSVLQSWQCGA